MFSSSTPPVNMNVRRAEGRGPRQKYANELQTLHHCGLTLHVGAGCATWDASPIKLTPREFALLECFMKHTGEVLDQAIILERAWGISADPQTNIIQVYVNRLRRALKQAGARPLIKTVRGFGYCFGPIGWSVPGSQNNRE